MAEISNTTRPAYVWDATGGQWIPIGVGAHTHPVQVWPDRGSTAARPASASQGDLYYDTTLNNLYQYNGTDWVIAGTVAPTAPTSIEVLVVAGGGASGNASNVGAGGGAGGLVYQAARTPASSFTVTVGAGGSVGSSGVNSVLDTITANGGGRGGSENYVGATGGSGGGSTWAASYNTPGSANQGNSGGGTGYGFAGGSGLQNAGPTGNLYPSGGGGGAGAAGQSGSSAAASGRGGNGGVGLAYSITGSSTYYAGGGGGGSWTDSTTYSTGGLGGGGRGGANIAGGDTPAAGTTNTGGGGGGNGSSSTSGTAGGSGVVIIAYPSTNTALSSIGVGLTYSVSTTSRAGYRVYTFTSGTGTVTI